MNNAMTRVPTLSRTVGAVPYAKWLPGTVLLSTPLVRRNLTLNDFFWKTKRN